MAIEEFGALPDGRSVDAVTLSNGRLTVKILTLGAITHDLRLEGVPHALTLGSPELAAYLGPMAYFGAIVGPVANRIAGGTAMLDGQALEFQRNENGRTTLHGGETGIHSDVWTIREADDTHLRLTLSLPDGRGGFPGNREIAAEFWVSDPACLELRLEAATDAPTLMNLAHHGYWNLDGAPTVAGHRLQVEADRWLPVDGDLIPTGEVRPVDGTPWDFRTEVAFRPHATGYDNNLCLSDARRALTPVLRLTGRTGTTLRLSTTEPGLQLYAAAGLDTAPHAGHGGSPYREHAGMALEPQVWPDAPNRPDFPSAGLRPGETYRQETHFDFSSET